MEPYKFYIEQTSFDGEAYTLGRAYDTYETWGIVCSAAPYRPAGDPKDVATRDWLDEHGEEVYIPADVKLKKFDFEVSFLCNGTEEEVKYNVSQFRNFLLGEESRYKRKSPSGPDVEVVIPSTGARLAIYDNYNSVGWKDVRFKAFSSDGLVMDNSDTEIVLEFKVTFEVFDPSTTVEVVTNPHGSSIIWQD